MSMPMPKTMLLAVLVLVVALSDFNVAVHGESLVKVVNNLDGGLNLTLSCKYTPGGLNPPNVNSVLKSGETQELRLDVERIPFTTIGCTFKWAGHSHEFPVYINYRDFGYCRKKCTWSIKQDKPCMVDADNFPDLHSCYPWNK